MNVDNCVLFTLIYRAIEFDVKDDYQPNMPEKLKRTVAILYQLCFGLSQMSNFF